MTTQLQQTTSLEQMHSTSQRHTQDIEFNRERVYNDWELLNRVQHRYSPHQRMRTCNMVPIPANHNNVEISSSNIRGTKFKGLVRCRSRWCPTCNKIDVAVQQGMLLSGYFQMVKNGFIPFFFTFTQPRCEDIEKANTDMGYFMGLWKKAMAYKYRGKFDVKNMVISKDYTFNLDNPKQLYHLHLHNLLFVHKSMFETDQEKVTSLEALKAVNKTKKKKRGVLGRVQAFMSEMTRIWVEKTGYKASLKGQDVRVSEGEDIITYIKKVENSDKLVWELISKAKRQTHSTNTISWVGLLQRIANTHSKKAIAIYKSFLNKMKGKKNLSIGQGIKKLVIDDDVRLATHQKLSKQKEATNEKTKSYRISSALMKMIGLYRLQGALATMLDLSWDDKASYSMSMFEILVDECNKQILNPSTIPKEIQELKPFLLCLIEALQADNIIETNKALNIKEKLR